MITSTSNPRIKNIVKLLAGSRERKEQGLFVVEGEKLFMEAPLERIDSVFVSESCLARLEKRSDKGRKAFSEDCLKKLEDIGYETVSDAVFARMSDTSTPQGIMCTIKSTDHPLEKLLEGSFGELKRVLLLEGVQDPGNLGTMLRTAEAAGYDAVIADADTADRHNPKVIRSTMGAIYRMKVSYCKDIKDAVKRCREKGFCVYAAHLKGKVFYDETVYAERTAIIIGNESKGLSAEVSQLADMLVRIPMEGRAESLNAAVAAAILMYQSRIRRSSSDTKVTAFGKPYTERR
ncbi:MAG: RNA methyltransferase [Lachnospiraceae bacterium]|nr:RNA methyltransferase [Lachnospiraceae bacterium]